MNFREIGDFFSFSDKKTKKARGSRARREMPSRTRKKKRSTATSKSKPSVGESLLDECLAVVLVFAALFLGSSLFSFFLSPASDSKPRSWVLENNLMGPLGGHSANFLYALIGWCSILVPLGLCFLSYAVWQYGKGREEYAPALVVRSIFFSALIAISCATVLSAVGGGGIGGAIGSLIAASLVGHFNVAGTALIGSAVFLLSFGFASGRGFSFVVKIFASFVGLLKAWFADVGYFFARSGNFVFSRKTWRPVWRGLLAVFSVPRDRGGVVSDLPEAEDELQEWTWEDKGSSPRTAGGRASAPIEEEPLLGDFTPDSLREARDLRIKRRNAEEPAASGSLFRRNKKKSKQKRVSAESTKLAKVQQSDFVKPSVDLLISGDTSFAAAPEDKELIANSKRLEKTLADFRVGGRVVEVHPGPVITLYQFEPAPGIKVQRIVNLADDLALSLKVGSVRVYAPVPGKGTVGIEVPNEHREMVRLRDILDSDEFRKSESSLTLAIGKDTFGDPYATDLAKMPHLLIAGSTGSGKSVSVNTILLSFIYRNTPEELRLILIDPKMLELSVYEGIPHLKAPVVTNPKRARGVLFWAVEEMERRYGLMKEMGVRNLASYNRMLGSRPSKREEGLEEAVIRLEEESVVATGTLDARASAESTAGAGFFWK